MPLPTAAGTPSPPQSPRKDFCRAKMPCGGERLLDLLPGSLIVERIAYQIAAAIQKESAIKNRRRLSHWSGTACLEPMGFQKGPQTLLLCCAASATTAISSRRLDTALLCAAKKRGVETYQAGRALPVNPWSLDHGSSQKAPPAAALDSKALAAGRQQKNRRTFVRRFSLPYLLLYALMPRASRSMARSSLSCLRM